MASVTNFACLCGGGMGAIGVPSCIERYGLSVKDIFMDTFDGDGQRNSIKATDMVNGQLPFAFLLDKFNEADPTKRWNITPDLYEEVAPSRTDNQTQESATGTIKTLRNGVRIFLAELWEVPDSWAAKINKAKCNKQSTFKIDEAGNMAGEVSADGSEFYPLMIQKGTLNATPFEATPAKDAYTAVTYQLSRQVVEGSYLTLSAAQIEGDMRSANSMIGMDLVQGDGTNSVTELFVDAFNVTYGTFDNFTPLVGATTPSDWDVTDSALSSVTVSSVDELSDGVYKLTIPTAPSGNTIVAYAKARTALSEIGYVADAVTLVIP
jgi:hypothetical protein